MYQVIARKYRPLTFAGLISQAHVRTTLENAISQGRIAHGYIFSGQRGTGKTTVARILARCLNCEQGPTPAPCMSCASCAEIASGAALDVIEIDAASNRGINEMRELRENVRFRPARGRYKIFIIDEAHQITSEAFNALLKTLEEPPEWVVFVLCTTEAHKIPTTIASRCQQFSFRSVDFAELTARLEWICQQEGIEADAEVLSVLAQAGEGSVRDSESALDQAIACCGTKLRAPEVRDLLGMFSLASLEQVAEALHAGDPRRMLEVVAELDANGRSLHHFARELARYVRNLLVVHIAGTQTRLVAASAAEQAALASTASKFSEQDLTRALKLTLDLFRDLQGSLQPRLHLEMGLLRLVHAGKLQPIEDALAALAGSGPAPAPPRKPSGPAPAAGDLRSRLHAALVEEQRSHLADAVQHSQVEEFPGEVVLTAGRVERPLLRDPALEAVARSVLGRPVRITIQAHPAEPPAAGRPAPEGPQDDARERALAHPEVRRFQEMFPGSQVRQVRNLRESEP
jgi:DNA polymerase-3 subunit gamma/tau